VTRVCEQCQRIRVQRTGEFRNEKCGRDKEGNFQAVSGTATMMVGMMMPVMIHNNRSI
jgi:hypothetical protein